MSEKTQADQTVTRSAEMLRALNAAAAATLRERAARSPDAVFEAVGRELEQLGLYSLVALLDEERRRFVVRYATLYPPALTMARKALGLEIVGYTFPVEQLEAYRQVVETRQTVFDAEPAKSISRVLPEPLRALAAPVLQVMAHVRSISAPMTVGGELLGILSVTARTLTPADVPAITAFADLVSAMLENAQLYEQLARREQETAAINAIVQALNASRDVRDVFGAVARELGSLVPFDRASIVLLSADRQSFTMYVLLDQPDAPLGEGVTMPVSATAAGPNVLAGRPHLTPDLSVETDYPGERLLYEAGLRSRVNVPLQIGDRVLGALNLASAQPAAFSERQVGLLQQVAGAIAVAIQNAQLYEQVQESEARYRHLVENVHDLIYEEDATGVITYCSPAIEHLSGYTADEVVGRSFVEFVHPDDLPGLLESLDRTLAGVLEPAEFRVRTKDGRMAWARTFSRLVMRDGQVAGLTGVATDITARKLAEQSLARREAILRAVSFAAERFLQPNDFDDSVQAVLARLGEATGVSRIYIFQNHPAPTDDLLTSQRYEWAAAGIAPQIDNPDLQNLALVQNGFEHWITALSQDEVICDLVRNRPPSERAILQAQDIFAIAIVPIHVAGAWWGFIGLDDCVQPDRTWSPAEVDALRAAAGTLGAAIQRQRMEETLHRRNEQLDALLASARHITSTLDLDQVLQRVIESAIAAVGPAEKGSLHLWDASRGELCVQTSVGYPPNVLNAVTLQPGEGFAGWVFAHQDPLIVGNVHADPRFKPIDLTQVQEEKSLLCVPLVVRDQAIGTLSLDNVSRCNAFTPEHLDLLTIFASQVAVAIENARLFQETHQRAADLSTLYDIITAATASVHLDEILNRTVTALQQALKPDDIALLLIEPETNDLVIRAMAGFSHANPPLIRRRMGMGIPGWVAQEGQPVLLADVRGDERYHECDPDTRSELCVPLSTRSRVIGVLNIESHRPGAFTEADLHLVSTLASHLATVIENARLYQTLRESETRYRALFEQANDAVFLETLDGRILDVNARACEMLGYSRDELVSMSVHDLLPPALETQVPQLIERELQNGGLRLEAENVRRDGSRVPVEVSTSVLRLNGDELVLALVRDISERRRLEEQLRQAQKMEAIGTLAGGIAHDFNNLLGGILGFASLMERDLPADSPLRTSVDTIIQSARRGAELTNQLLAFARGGRYEVRPTSLNDVTHEVLRLLARTADKTITLEACLAPNLAPVEGDAGQLHQMLLNLCLNACDAMPTGGYLTVETENVPLGQDAPTVLGLAPGAYVRLSVIDTGMGMDQETQQRIFEPFFTTKKGRPGKPHSGLGLAMVYGIVRSHGGGIQVDSALGRGATFTIYLPAGQEPPSAPELVPAESAGGVETILVVDDEDFIRSLLQQALASAGYTVLTADDGWQALEVYQKHWPHIDLIVLDMGLPRLGGADTFRHLQEIDPDVAVLISSGYAEDDRTRAVLNAGARGFLPKPYDLDELLSKVRQVLDHQTSAGHCV